MKTSLAAVIRPRLLLALILVACLPAGAADDETVNRLLASQCAQCHGTNGYAQGDFESIAGEEAKDLTEDLLDMKGEDRPENIMDHQALGYTDDQIRRIASYYAGLPEDRPGGEGESEESGDDDQDSDDGNGSQEQDEADEDEEEEEEDEQEDEDEEEDEDDEEEDEDD